MTNTNRSIQVNNKYILISALAVFLSWVMHEFAHWTAGEYVGLDMGMTLNKTFPTNGDFISELNLNLVSAAGPIFTIIEASVIFQLLIQKRREYLYPFLFTCFYMRLLATVISFRNPNDEARISKSLGLGTFTLPILVTLVLFFLVFKTSKDYKFDLSFNIKTLGLIILFSSIVILSDQYFQIRLL